MKNKLDQFYTNPKIVDELLNDLFSCFYSLRLTPQNYFFVEPSAGTGNFIDGLYKIGIDINNQVFAIDIDPKNNEFIKKMDFFNTNVKSYCHKNKTIITIGNPPFGKKGDMALEFLNKSLEYSDIVAMILPKTFRRFSLQNKIKKDAKLIFDKSLKSNSFLVNDREYNVNCCFQIWINPNIIVSTSDLRLKKQIKSLENDIKLFIHNNTQNTLKYFDKQKYKWDFAIHRQGFYNYNELITDQSKLIKNHQYLFVKCNNKKILNIIKEIDFNLLAKKNSTTTFGFSNSDFYNEVYKKIIYSSIEEKYK